MSRKKKEAQAYKYPFFDVGSLNSSDGFAWQARFYDRCYRDINKCNIIAYALAGEDWKHQLVIKDGKGICLSFKTPEEHVPIRRVSRKQRMAAAAQIDLFNDNKSKKKE